MYVDSNWTSWASSSAQRAEVTSSKSNYHLQILDIFFQIFVLHPSCLSTTYCFINLFQWGLVNDIARISVLLTALFRFYLHPPCLSTGNVMKCHFPISTSESYVIFGLHALWYKVTSHFMNIRIYLYILELFFLCRWLLVLKLLNFRFSAGTQSQRHFALRLWWLSLVLLMYQFSGQYFSSTGLSYFHLPWGDRYLTWSNTNMCHSHLGNR